MDLFWAVYETHWLLKLDLDYIYWLGVTLDSTWNTMALEEGKCDTRYIAIFGNVIFDIGISMKSWYWDFENVSFRPLWPIRNPRLSELNILIDQAELCLVKKDYMNVRIILDKANMYIEKVMFYRLGFVQHVSVGNVTWLECVTWNFHYRY